MVALAILSATVLTSVGPSVDAGRTSLADDFGRAPEEYGVPRDLLFAMGYVNTRREMPQPSAGNYRGGLLYAGQMYDVVPRWDFRDLVTSEGAGFYLRAMPKRRERQRA